MSSGLRDLSAFHERRRPTRVAADALARAGVGLDEFGHLDLYSCFASSVLFAIDALVVADLDGGARAYARTSHPDALAALGQDEWVGRRVGVRTGLTGSNEILI